jgi:hypothetical protein
VSWRGHEARGAIDVTRTDPIVRSVAVLRVPAGVCGEVDTSVELALGMSLAAGEQLRARTVSERAYAHAAPADDEAGAASTDSEADDDESADSADGEVEDEAEYAWWVRVANTAFALESAQPRSLSAHGNGTVQLLATHWERVTLRANLSCPCNEDLGDWRGELRALAAPSADGKLMLGAAAQGTTDRGTGDARACVEPIGAGLLESGEPSVELSLLLSLAPGSSISLFHAELLLPLPTIEPLSDRRMLLPAGSEHGTPDQQLRIASCAPAVATEHYACALSRDKQGMARILIAGGGDCNHGDEGASCSIGGSARLLPLVTLTFAAAPGATATDVAALRAELTTALLASSVCTAVEVVLTDAQGEERRLRRQSCGAAALDAGGTAIDPLWPPLPSSQPGAQLANASECALPASAPGCRRYGDGDGDCAFSAFDLLALERLLLLQSQAVALPLSVSAQMLQVMRDGALGLSDALALVGVLAGSRRFVSAVTISNLQRGCVSEGSRGELIVAASLEDRFHRPAFECASVDMLLLVAAEVPPFFEFSLGEPTDGGAPIRLPDGRYVFTVRAVQDMFKPGSYEIAIRPSDRWSADTLNVSLAVHSSTCAEPLRVVAPQLAAADALAAATGRVLQEAASGDHSEWLGSMHLLPAPATPVEGTGLSFETSLVSVVMPGGFEAPFPSPPLPPVTSPPGGGGERPASPPPKQPERIIMPAPTPWCTAWWILIALGCAFATLLLVVCCMYWRRLVACVRVREEHSTRERHVSPRSRVADLPDEVAAEDQARDVPLVDPCARAFAPSADPSSKAAARPLPLVSDPPGRLPNPRLRSGRVTPESPHVLTAIAYRISASQPAHELTWAEASSSTPDEKGLLASRDLQGRQHLPPIPQSRPHSSPM